MKTIGEQAREFRESKGWNTTRMAKEVGTYRQSIENLELTGDRVPKYMVSLARVMGTTVDALMTGHATADITTPSPFITANGGPNQPLASANTAQGAININANRRAKPTAQEVLTALGELIANVDPALIDGLAGLMASFVRAPSNPTVVKNLVGMLTPQAFVQQGQRTG